MYKNEQQLQDELVKRYLSNLEFFKNYDLELFNKLDTLSSAINQGVYKERYALEYVKEIKDFDILVLEDKTYLYNKNMKKVNHNLQKEVSLDKKGVFSTLNNVLYKSYSKNNELPSSKFKLLDEYVLEDMSKYSLLFSDLKENTKYKSVDKVMFLGTALGGHINRIRKNINAKICFIYEPDLELFRLSLFVTDYSYLSKYSKLLFSIMDTANDFSVKLDYFISSMAQFSNYNIKYSKMSYISDEVLHNILSQLHISNSNLFDYAKVLYQTVYSSTGHLGKYKILTSHKKTKDFYLTNKKPILFVAAGPSFSKNLLWLQENQNKFTIVALGATYKKLFDNNIRVDVVTTADPQYDILNNTHFNKEDTILLKDTIILASINTPTKILNRFNQEKLFLFEVYQSFKDSSNVYNGVSVGEVSLAILLDLGVEDIYLFGVDLALDYKTGLSHYEGYKNQKASLTDKSKVDSILIGENQDLREEYLKVKGNKNNEVITSRVFALSINMYTKLISTFKTDKQRIYNLSSEGAYISGTEYKDLASVNIPSSEIDDISNILFKQLLKVSEKKLTDSELSKISKRVKFTNDLNSVVSSILSSSNSKKIEDFNTNLDKVIQKIIETNDYTFTNIIGNYLNLTLPYIYSNLNNNKISSKDERKKIKEVEQILSLQLGKIIEVYNYYLKQI